MAQGTRKPEISPAGCKVVWMLMYALPASAYVTRLDAAVASVVVSVKEPDITPRGSALVKDTRTGPGRTKGVVVGAWIWDMVVLPERPVKVTVVVITPLSIMTLPVPEPVPVVPAGGARSVWKHIGAAVETPERAKKVD